MAKRNARIWICAGAACILAFLLSLCLGAAAIHPRELFTAMAKGPKDTAGFIFWYARLPRTAGCMLAGAALAVSGAVIQSVLNNRLASPGIVGVNAGAGLAVTVCAALGTFSPWVSAGAAFLGAAAAVLLIVLLAQKTGASRSALILGGVAVNAVLNALSEGVLTLVPEAGIYSGDFRVGGFSSVSYLRLIPAAVWIVASVAVLLTLCNELDILSLGAETAQSLGLKVRTMRTVFLLLAAMLAGAAVSFGGLLGFVGLLVPHGARKLVGNESRFLLPMCVLGGAAFVTVCDLAARMLFAPFELPVGILLSLLGGPAFLVLLLKRKGGRRDA